MDSPDMLQHPAIIKWLGGIEPAWTLLEEASFTALRRPPSPTKGPIRLAADLTPEEVQRSPVARNALVLLRAAAEGPGLKMTATGNLSRAVVAEMCDRFTWPGFDTIDTFQFHNVINEPDFLPLFFVRHVAQTATLLRRHKGRLRVSPAGRRMLEEPDIRTLLAVLFHVTFWHVDLGYLSRGLHTGWPQRDAGIVLWSLSVAANDWQLRESLTRLCTVPTDALFDRTWDTASFAMDAQILQPLEWFGLLEHRQDEIEPGHFLSRHFYRKTALFDRVLSFDIKLDTAGASHH